MKGIDKADYNFAVKETANLLKRNEQRVAVKCPEFSVEHLESEYQEPLLITWQDYFEKADAESIESIRMQEHFGFYL